MKNFIIHILPLFIAVFLTSSCKKDSSNTIQQIPIHSSTKGELLQFKMNDGSTINVLYKNGDYIIAGDIILSNKQLEYLKQNSKSKTKENKTESTFISEFTKLWPDGKVYYTISDNSKSSTILSAINNWEANTSIRFIQRTNQRNYIDFAGAPSLGSGDSQLGMIGGRQLIRLAGQVSPEWALTTATHEIGHALGLMHEQTREDRDDYINVNYNNINSNWKFQYDKYTDQDRIGFQIGAFDFQSIMLYRSDNSDARVNGNTSPQMTKKKDGSTWSDNYFLSQGDIDAVNYLYRPGVYVRVRNVYTDGFDNPDDFEHNYDIIAYFYSNIECTIPLSISNKIRFNYYMEKIDYGYQGSVRSDVVLKNSVEIPAGNSYYFLGKGVESMRYDYGTIVSGTYIDYSPLTGIGYINYSHQ